MRTIHSLPHDETLQRLAKTDLSLAIELGVAEAHRQRALALREAFRDAGLGLAQLFGLTHRPLPVRGEPVRLSRG